MNAPSKQRWSVVAIFFFFMLLHQSDKLLIGPLTSDIEATFKINDAQMGAVFTGALIVGAVFYPLWGYLYDRYSRAKLISLASLIWGATTWFSAVAPTFPLFVATRASTGVDDSSYPGLYSLIADYFPPSMRGKIYGLLELTMPLGYLIGMVMALMLGGLIGWRAIFYITGSLGIVLAVVIFFGVKDVPRGQCEPELSDLKEMGTYRFNWKIARDLFKKPSLRLLFVQGFFGVFPWNVITYWFFTYLGRERGYSDNQILLTMVPTVLILALGYPLGGALGDWLFARTPRGRAIVSTIGVVMGAIMLYLTINVPLENTLQFGILLGITAIFIPFAAPNVISTVYDITLPEVRSTAFSIQSFIESGGAALAPLIAGIISTQGTLRDAILLICLTTWALCGVFFLITSILVPKDINMLRNQLKERAENEKRLSTDLS